MAAQIIPPVKGTRDFHPEEMAFRNWLYGKIKKVSEKFGFQEFDGPLIEYLDLYSDKTSEEILKEQAFSLKDRDGRDILLRPEITPTLARMIAQKSSQLIKPIKWFSFGRAYRYEQPQKGRNREFFQWEIDIVGPKTPEADTEILAVAVEYFKELGLTPDEVVIRVNDRSYFEQVLKENDIPEEKFKLLLQIIDRKEKISPEQFNTTLKDSGLSESQISSLNNYFENPDFSKAKWLSEVFDSLKNYSNALDYIVYDPTIARGLDYYTGVVFEAWDKTGGLKRALFGGGRFDNLTQDYGGEALGAQGMAPGDVPIQVVLEQFGKMPKLTPQIAKVLVTTFSPELTSKSIEVGTDLRSNEINTEVWLDPSSKLDKQLKYADQKNIPFVIILGPEEMEKDVVVLKNFKDNTQETLPISEVISKLKS